MDPAKRKAPFESLYPPSPRSQLEEGEIEERGGNQVEHQATQPIGTQQPRLPEDTERIGPSNVSQAAIEGISIHSVDNDPALGYSKTFSPQLSTKGPRASTSGIETLPELSKEQLATLRDILSQIEVTSTSKVEFIWSSVLQLAGLLFVVVFGVFAALAYDAANVANKQSSQANQLALLNLCISQYSPSDTCVAVQQNSFDLLDSLATAIPGPGVVLTTSARSPSSTPTSASSKSITTDSSSSTTTSPSGTSQSTTTPASSTTAGTQSATPTQTSGSNAPGSSRGSTHHLSTPALVGTVVGVVSSVVSISISGCAFYVRFAETEE